MRSLREYIRLYFIIEAQYIKARMQYRADFIISSFGMFFASLSSLAIFWVLFESIPDLAGWSLMEMVFIYAFYMLAISPMQILFDNFWQLRFHVQEGTFLKYYFRPLNMMFYYTSEMFDLKGLTQLLAGIILLIYSSMQLDLIWSFPPPGPASNYLVQCRASTDFHYRCFKLRRVLGGQRLAGAGTGLLFA